MVENRVQTRILLKLEAVHPVKRAPLLWPIAAVRRRLEPSQLFAWLGGTSLFLLVFMVPPFQVPDEPQHFFRSYQLSMFQARSEVREGIAGTELPASLPDLVERFLGTNILHTTQRRQVPKQRFTETIAELQRPLDPERTVFVEFSGTAFSFPLPYVPQALAIAVGRNCGIGPLGLMYMGRLANALASAIVIWIAISLFPFGRTFGLLVACLPMTLFMSASLSPDAMTIASAFLFTAIIARFLNDGVWSRRHQLVGFACGMIMCATKVVYFPMLCAGLGTFLVRGRLSNPRQRSIGIWQAGAALLVLIVVSGWFWSVQSGNKILGREGVDAAGQMSYLAQNMFQPLKVVLRSLYVRAEFLGQSMIGYFGWLNVLLPNWVYSLLGVAMPLSVVADSREARPAILIAVWLGFIVFVVVAAIELALFVAWTPVGAYAAEGVQGRYFIPALPMLGLAGAALFAGRASPGFSDHAYLMVVFALGVASIAMHYSIFHAYGLF